MRKVWNRVGRRYSRAITWSWYNFGLQEMCSNQRRLGKGNDGDVKIMTDHAEFAYDIKVSNDNTKGEKRVTVHVRSDTNPEAAQKLADKLYKDELGS